MRNLLISVALLGAVIGCGKAIEEPTPDTSSLRTSGQQTDTGKVVNPQDSVYIPPQKDTTISWPPNDSLITQPTRPPKDTVVVQPPKPPTDTAVIRPPRPPKPPHYDSLPVPPRDTVHIPPRDSTGRRR
ncbi:hypothetical protein ACO2Q8_23210 [Larkinella sp. VNQ87]|uniref:hypothetical protein n=1 Tax=Larkinella sp. VNQ87 TaxID=3400921 RepID=UPI003C01CC01